MGHYDGKVGRWGIMTVRWGDGAFLMVKGGHNDGK